MLFSSHVVSAGSWSVLSDNWNQISLERHLTVLPFESDGDEEGDAERTTGRSTVGFSVESAGAEEALMVGLGDGFGVGRLDGEFEGELEVRKLGG